MNRGRLCLVCGTNNTPIDPVQAKAIIAAHWQVPAEVRARRRSKKGRPPRQSEPDNRSHPLNARADGATFPDQHGRRPRPTQSTAALDRTNFHRACKSEVWLSWPKVTRLERANPGGPGASDGASAFSGTESQSRDRPRPRPGQCCEVGVDSPHHGGDRQTGRVPAPDDQVLFGWMTTQQRPVWGMRSARLGLSPSPARTPRRRAWLRPQTSCG